jgi:Protein of unknown function (DUF3667)
MSHKKYRVETDCLNCGAEVTGKFCSACGQENLEVRDSFVHLVGHFFSDYFHYDSKFFRSLKLLFFKPGFLTKQYWDGKRVQYIHPLRLYFFVVVIGVLLAGVFFEQYKAEIKQHIIRDNTNLSDMGPEIVIRDTVKLDTSEDLNLDRGREKMYPAEARERLSGAIDRFVSHFKYIMFGLLPVFALIFKILYFRRKSFYVDHLIYAMHLQSFAFLSRLSIAIVGIMVPILDSSLKLISYGLIMAYTAISLRYLYHQSWWKTILKALIATALLMMVLILVFVTYMATVLFL